MCHPAALRVGQYGIHAGSQLQSAASLRGSTLLLRRLPRRGGLCVSLFSVAVLSGGQVHADDMGENLHDLHGFDATIEPLLYTISADEQLEVVDVGFHLLTEAAAIVFLIAHRFEHDARRERGRKIDNFTKDFDLFRLYFFRLSLFPKRVKVDKLRHDSTSESKERAEREAPPCLSFDPAAAIRLYGRDVVRDGERHVKRARIVAATARLTHVGRRPELDAVP